MTNFSPRVSIVIPMFNCEKFIATTIDSILNQTFQDFEIILLDNCSIDRTVKIVQNYKDPRIRLHRNVINLYESRNLSLALTNESKYIYFMNSGDAILTQTLETLVNAAEESQAEVVYMNSRFIAQDANFKLNDKLKVNKQFIKNPQPRFLSTDLYTRLQNEFIEQGISRDPGMKLLRRDFILENAICYPDEIENLAILLNTKNARVIDFCGYIHRNRSGISSSKKLRESIKSLPKIIENLEKLLQNLPTENRLTLESQVIFNTSILNLVRFDVKIEEQDRILRDFFESHNTMNPAIFQTIFDAFILFATQCSNPDPNRKSIFQLKGVQS